MQLILEDNNKLITLELTKEITGNYWLVNSKKENVATRDQWHKIIPYFDNFWYTFSKVPAHSNIFWNEKCDKMVQEVAERMKFEWRGEKHD